MRNDLATSSRREILRQSMLGFGAVALTDLLARHAVGSQAAGAIATPSKAMPGPLAARAAHFAPRAKRVIYIFLDGGLSQIDSYDYKPRLTLDDGKALPASIAKPRFTFAPTGQVLASPFKWERRGQRGMWASDLFPEVNRLIDRLCFIHSLYHDNEDHFTAKNMIFTGSGREVRPPLGSWVTYGLGTENENLPAYIDIMPGVPKSTPSAFLPARYASTAIGRPTEKSRDREWDNLRPLDGGGGGASSNGRNLDFLRMMNRDHASRAGLDKALEGEIQNMELAFRMQTQAPDLLTLAGESAATKALYGIGEPTTDDFGRACLMARRFSERGVRYITLMHSTRAFGNLWDQHKDLYDGHRNNAVAVDKPIAGLLRDLASRGMLEDTLVMCGSEFGRTPVFEFQNGNDGRLRNGRDHNPHGFTMWFAGGGFRPGVNYGATDDYGYYAVRDKVSIHDLHATILAAMGLDHERLTYPHGGRDYRLTDVSGNVVTPVLS